MTHKSRLVMSLVVIALVVAVSPVEAQRPTRSDHKLEDLGFLAGRWAGAAGEARSEYFWSLPDAGTILGTSRRMKGQKTLVSYFFIIESTDSGIIYRFKHFNDDYTTYEDRNNEGPREFKLALLESNAVIFEEINKPEVVFVRYRLTEADQLAIKVGASIDELRDEDAPETVLARVK